MPVEVFKAFGVAAKNGIVSEKRIREIIIAAPALRNGVSANDVKL